MYSDVQFWIAIYVVYSLLLCPSEFSRKALKTIVFMDDVLLKPLSLLFVVCKFDVLLCYENLLALSINNKDLLYYMRFCLSYVSALLFIYI